MWSITRPGRSSAGCAPRMPDEPVELDRLRPGLRRRSRSRGPQAEDDPPPPLAVRLDPDAATHPSHELVTDVEPEPRAAHAAGHLRVEAVELLEDLRLLAFRDAQALVPHPEADVTFVGRDADLDRPAVGRVLDRVLDEVDENLPPLVLVGRDWWDIAGADRERDRGGGMNLWRLHHALDDFRRLEGLGSEVETPRVELVREQDLVDDPPEAL